VKNYSEKIKFILHNCLVEEKRSKQIGNVDNNIYITAKKNLLIVLATINIFILCKLNNTNMNFIIICNIIVYREY
jgi:hypothetical protein